MTGLEAWLLGYAGTKLLDKVLEFVRGDPFVNELHKAIETWAKALPEGATLGSTNALFPSHVPDNLLDARPALKSLRDQIRFLAIPETDQWRDALLEQWNFIRATGPGLEEFFYIEEEDANGYLKQLAERLDLVCSRHDDLFKTTMIRLVREIHAAIAAHTPDAAVTLQQLNKDQLAIIKRVSEFDGKCGIWAAKGEFECLWMPGQQTNTQWGWERTPAETALSGKAQGSRMNRMRWIIAATSLLELGLMKTLTEDEKVFELTNTGWELARQIRD